MEKMETGVKSWFEWIIERFPGGGSVGFDFTQYPAANLEARSKQFDEKKIVIKSVENLVDLTWGSDRPERPINAVKHLDIKFTGQETLDKFSAVTKKLDGKVDCLLVTTLDDICWILNLRGSDIDYNPVFFSYLIFYPGEEAKATLYVDDVKVEGIKDYLASNRVTISPYNKISEDLVNINAEKKKIGVHNSTCNAELHRLVKESAVA